MIQSFQVIKEGKSLKEVKDLSSFKGSMRTTLIKYMDELKINKIIKIKSCESLFNLDNKYLHTTSLVKYPVFDKGKNYSGVNILKKRMLLNFIEKNFLKELKMHQNLRKINMHIWMVMIYILEWDLLVRNYQQDKH